MFKNKWPNVYFSLLEWVPNIYFTLLQGYQIYTFLCCKGTTKYILYFAAMGRPNIYFTLLQGDPDYIANVCVESLFAAGRPNVFFVIIICYKAKCFLFNIVCCKGTRNVFFLSLFAARGPEMYIFYYCWLQGDQKCILFNIVYCKGTKNDF